MQNCFGEHLDTHDTVTHDHFRAYFETYGKVIDSVVMFHPETKRSRGFGFVTFQDPQVAQAVLADGNLDERGHCPPTPPGGWTSGKLYILNKECEVKASIPKKGGSGGSWKRKDKLDEPVVSATTSAIEATESSTPSFVEIPNMPTTKGDSMEVPGMVVTATTVSGANPGVVPVTGVPPSGGWIPNMVPVMQYPMPYPFVGYFAPQADPYYDGYVYGGAPYGYGAPVDGYGYPVPSTMTHGPYGYQEQAGGSSSGEHFVEPNRANGHVL